MITGAVREESFNPTAKFEQVASWSARNAEYSYNDGDLYYFMDPETYDMIPLNQDVLGDAFQFVKENTMCCNAQSYKGSVFSVEVPNFVDLEVTETEPGVKGDTATNVTKPATLETGAEIKVPLFINEGDKIQHRHPHRRVSGPLQGVRPGGTCCPPLHHECADEYERSCYYGNH